MALTFNEDQLLQLQNDFYGGYRTKQKAKYEMKGAGDGRAMTQTGYYDQLNTDYYKNNSIKNPDHDTYDTTGEMDKGYAQRKFDEWFLKYAPNSEKKTRKNK